MKILYVGRSRGDAEAAAAALHGVAQNVAVSWTSRLDNAAKWIEQNTDLGALVVEADVDRAFWRPVIDLIHGLATPAPVVVITSDTGPPFDLMEADEFVTRTGTVARDLPVVVRRALGRAAARASAEGQAQLQAAAERERAARAELERQLAEARTALREVDERCRSVAAAASEQAARQQAQYETAVARAGAAREMVDEQLRDAAAKVARSRLDQASAEAAVDRLSRRETELSSLLAEATAGRATLEERLAAAHTALEAATARAERDLRASTDRFAGERRELEARLAHEIQNRNTVEQTLARAISERDAAEKQHASAIADVMARTRELETAFRLLRQEFESQAADLDRHVKHEAELEAQIESERAACAGLEQAIADAGAALRETQRQSDAARSAAEQERIRRQAEFDRALAQAATDRDGLARRLTDADAALEQQRKAHQSATAEIERLEQREADLSSRLSDAAAERDALVEELAQAEAVIARAAEREREIGSDLQHERALRVTLEQSLTIAHAARDAFELQLTDAVKTIADGEERATRDRTQAAERQSDLEVRLAQAMDARATLERTLAEARSAALEAEQSFNARIHDLQAQALAQAAEFETRSAEERRAHDTRVAEMQEHNRDLTLARDALQQVLDANEEALRCLGDQHRSACQRFEQARAAADADIARLTGACAEADRSLQAARADHQGRLERLSHDHAAAFAARDQTIEQLRDQLAATEQMLQAARRDQELLQREADRIPDLLRQIEDSRAESERLFRQAQVAMFRCTREGTIIQVNRAWSALVRRTIDDLQSAAATAAIFESPGELSWLIDRCLSTRSRESIETTVRREDGVRLFVRMSASASASNVIEIVVEDLTRPRVLQDRLAQAGRMEAVGRLASEVALTCDRLLGDVRHHAEQWLMDAGGIGASRQHGEMLLDELTRAAGYLQQLAAYGDKQTRAPALVDLPTVVRDLVPVLKHVAGDHVDVRLPDPSSALTVDVESERIERLLVNLAAYGRERMSGRLTIEVGTSVVDRQFAARYPNVRPGPHALITVTEVRRAPRANALLPQRADSSGRNASPAVAQKPAVDLATLQGLVGECGGHLWMKVQPLGEIVAKIRLPLLTAYGQAHAPALAARAGRGRTIARWFHH